MPPSHTLAHIVLIQPRFSSFVCSELAAGFAGDHGLQSSLGWPETGSDARSTGCGAISGDVGRAQG